MKTEEPKVKEHSNPILAFLKIRRELGYKEEDTETIIDYVQHSREFDLSQLSTKDQLSLVEQRLESKIDAVDIKIDNLKQELTIKMEANSTLLKLKCILTMMVPMMLAMLGIVSSLWFK